MQMNKSYDPQSVEEIIYNFWLEKKLFHSVPSDEKKPFTIVIPPPNITGSLHMGHALNNTLQDAILRYKKLCGFNTCWIPGTDHGGIATQNVVEKILLSEGKNKNELGREKFLERMWEWKNEAGGLILHQLKKLGCALDWERTRFTMDEICSRAVIEAFVRLYNKGLIYRGKRLVNWCPRCMTALSDIEVEHEEEIGKLWHIKYPLKQRTGDREQRTENRGQRTEVRGQNDSTNSQHPTSDFIVVATTRPETMLGDTAVAVNPKDERYKKFIGAKLILPLVGREIPVIADDSVDSTFGTGAVKVTPAHDPADFEIAQRHNLEKIVVIDFDGKMTDNTGKYAKLDRYQARKEILKDLEEKGLLLETVDHPHSIGVCYRCNTTIEPLISEQWFLSVREMSRRAIDVVRAGKLKFYPSSWENQYINWLENLKDWCISRQIWWGHRIPVYYCTQKASPTNSCPPIVATEKPDKCPVCGNTNLVQDEDVLDTWFSSALWPFSVFGWPIEDRGQRSENRGRNDSTNSQHPTSDIDYYYPTSVLVTGHEILYLWVARMVQFGLEFMNEVPFRDVYIHGIVRDKFGKKMSKSLGNVIDPLEIMKKYGTDALRFSMISSATAGRDIQLSEDSFVGARNFANKLYNASRFIFLNLQNCHVQNLDFSDEEIEQTDRWILYELNKVISEISQHYERYELDKVVRLAYDFTWTKFCDWYIEFTKERLYGNDENSKLTAIKVLLKVLIDILKILHPVMPFLTEMLWQNIKNQCSGTLREQLSESIMNSQYPSVKALSEKYATAAEEINFLAEFISKIRATREEVKIPAATFINIYIRTSDEIKAKINANMQYIKKLARVESITQTTATPKECAYGITKSLEFFIPLKGVIDIEKEKKRLNDELEKIKKFHSLLSAKLQNKNFIEKAPRHEVENTTAKLKETETKIAKIIENLRYITTD